MDRLWRLAPVNRLEQGFPQKQSVVKLRPALTFNKEIPLMHSRTAEFIGVAPQKEHALRTFLRVSFHVAIYSSVISVTNRGSNCFYLFFYLTFICTQGHLTTFFFSYYT